MKTLAVACCVLLAAAGASADVLYPAALTFEPGYASGPPQGFPFTSAHPDYGDPLTMVGRVAEVRDPFTNLLPPGAELTYVFEGSTCAEWGNWDSPPCDGGIYGMFSSGTVSFYLDTTPDADFTNPSTFRNGEIVLVAETPVVVVLDADPQGVCPMLPDEPDMTAYLTFVGGTWFSLVSNQGVGFNGKSEGELDGNVPAELRALGYTFRVDGSVDIYGPVAVTSATWGSIKALYR